MEGEWKKIKENKRGTINSVQFETKEKIFSDAWTGTNEEATWISSVNGVWFSSFLQTTKWNGDGPIDFSLQVGDKSCSPTNGNEKQIWFSVIIYPSTEGERTGSTSYHSKVSTRHLAQEYFIIYLKKKFRLGSFRSFSKWKIE